MDGRFNIIRPRSNRMHGVAAGSISYRSAVSLDRANLLAQYKMLNGAADETGTYNGTLGLDGSFLPVQDADGILFNSGPQLFTLPRTLAQAMANGTDFWCLRMGQPGVANSGNPSFPFFQNSDGRLFKGQTGGEEFSAAEYFVGDMILAIVYGSSPKIYVANANGSAREVLLNGSQSMPLPDPGAPMRVGFDTHQYLGKWFYRVCYSSQKTAAQIASNFSFIRSQMVLRGVTTGDTLTDVPMIHCYGDSITAGVSAGSPVTNWPAYLRAALTDTLRISNFGYSGNYVSQINTRMQAIAPALLARTTATPKVCCMSGGVNNVKDLATSGAIITELTNFVTAARAAGYTKVILETIQNADWIGVYGQNQVACTAVVIAVNNAIQAKITGHDETADTTATAIGEGADGTDPTYYADGVHLTAAGQQIKKNAHEAALGALGVT